MTQTRFLAKFVSTLGLGLVLAAGACSKKEDSAKTADPMPAAKPMDKPADPMPTPTPAAGGPEAEAKKIFDTRCVACHGANGDGQGPAAASLDPKPANYSDPKFQASVTDEQIQEAILKGGAAVGKSASMPANPDLASKPEVVAALKDIIRGFGPKDAPAAGDEAMGDEAAGGDEAAEGDEAKGE